VKFVERKIFNDDFDDYEPRWRKLCRRQIRDHSLGHHGGEVPSSERRRTQVFILIFLVLRPPGSGSASIGTRYGSDSGSFFNQAKIVRKTLIPTVL
jgi:hypothetical protein